MARVLATSRKARSLSHSGSVHCSVEEVDAMRALQVSHKTSPSECSLSQCLSFEIDSLPGGSGCKSSKTNFEVVISRVPRSLVMSSIQLPPEVIDVVIDHLHQDKSALKACSLVCRNWLPASRLHLFSPLAITTINADALIVLLGHPLNTISLSVYHLQFHGMLSEKLLLFLSRFPCLSSLWLMETYWYTKGPMTPSPAAFLLPHARKLRFLTISDSFIYDLRVFVDIISAMPSLEDFTIRNIRWDPISSQGSVRKLHHPSPIRMHVQGLGAPLVASLAEVFGSDEKLRLVSLGLRSFDFGDTTKNMFKFINSFLENLQISLAPGGWRVELAHGIAFQETFLPVDCFAKLRSFGVNDIILNYTDPACPAISSWIIRLVSQTSSRLEELTLGFSSTRSLWDDLNTFDWESLSDCLSVQELSGLKRFKISIRSVDGMFGNAERAVREKLPKFSRILRVTGSAT